MDALFGPSTLLFLTKLGIAMILGMVIGIERIVAHKTAGMRTYALVSMGSALFVIISELALSAYRGTSGLNPLQLVGQIVSGIGFLGAGLIIFKDQKLMGLTTATGIWVSAGIGMAAGFGFFNLAILSTVLTLFIFVVLWFVEERIKKMPLVQKSNPDEGVTPLKNTSLEG
jgi:putative Mg2+ transporter-C (MgtC) family protein